MKKIKDFFKTLPARLKGFKKLTAFALGLITLFLQDTLGFSPETVTEIAAFISVYILGQSIADNGSDRPVK